VRERLTIHFSPPIQVGQVTPGFDVVRVETQGSVVFADGLLDVLVVHVGAGQPEADLGRVFLHPDQLTVLLYGLRVTSPQRIDVGQQPAAFGAGGIRPQRLPVFDDRLIEHALFLIEDPQVAMYFGRSPFQTNGFPVRGDGLFVPAGCRIGVAKAHKGLRIARPVFCCIFQLRNCLCIISGLQELVALAQLLHQFHGTVSAAEKVFILGLPEIPPLFICRPEEEMDLLALGVDCLQPLQLVNRLVGLIPVQIEGSHPEPRIFTGRIGNDGLLIFLAGLVVLPLLPVDISKTGVERGVTRQTFDGFIIVIRRKGVDFLFRIYPCQSLVVARVACLCEGLGELQGCIVQHPFLEVDPTQVPVSARKGRILLEAFTVACHGIIEFRSALVAGGLDKTACRAVRAEIQDAFFQLLPFSIIFLTKTGDYFFCLGAFPGQSEGPVKTAAEGSKDCQEQKQIFFHRYPRSILA